MPPGWGPPRRRATLGAVMRRVLALLLVAFTTVAWSAPPAAQGRGKKGSRAKKPKAERHDARGAIVLDGERVEVKWTDGDSFKFLEGPHKGRGTRLVGYNTLEAYGPVHQWGSWTPEELYELAKSSSALAAAREWACTTSGKADGYGRLLVSCPDLAVEMAREGHGLAFAVDGEGAAPDVLAAQADARRAGRGMWAKGTPGSVVTSLHSVGEEGGKGQTAYNRVVDASTGQALQRQHRQRWATCELVCEGAGSDTSCLVYVPFKQRYRGKPDCLKASSND